MGILSALISLGITFQVPGPDVAREAIKEAKQEHAAILADEAKILGQIADREAKAGRAEVAKTVRALIQPPSSGPTRFRPLPPIVTAGDLAASRAKIPEPAWAVRRKTVASLSKLARNAAAPPARCFALADRCLRDVLEREPDHAEARRLLGFVPYQGGWATPDAKKLMEDHYVLHSTFGWVDKEWVEHLDRGELPAKFDGRKKPTSWLPADQVDAMHSRWEDAWRIDTAPHFQIRANVPIAEAITYARHLESLHEFFFSEFADVIGAENLPLARRMADARLQPSSATKKFEVYYFANKQEYVKFFRDEFGMNEDVSLGYYMPLAEARRAQAAKNRKVPPRSYFYKDDKYPIAALATLFHEASHQILFETAGAPRIDPKKSQYWIWEGLGTYFETMTPQPDGSIVVGELVGPRIASAKERILNRGEYVPIAKLIAMDEAAFKDPENEAVNRHYAEGMALAVFFLDGEGGRYRQEFLEFVTDLYRGRGRNRTLDDRMGATFAELDAQFLKFLR